MARDDDCDSIDRTNHSVRIGRDRKKAFKIGKRLGRMFVVDRLDVPTTAEIICQGLNRQGFAVSSESESDGTHTILGVQRAGWFLILLRGLPQRLIWQVHADTVSQRTIVRHEHRWFCWHLLTVIAVAAATSLLAVATCTSFSHFLDEDTLPAVSHVVLPWATLLSGGVLLKIVQSGTFSTLHLMDDIRGDARKAGGLVDEDSTGLIERQNIGGLVILAVVLMAGTFLVWSWTDGGLPRPTTPSKSLNVAAVFVIVLLLGIVAMVLWVLVISLRRRGAATRLVPVLPALLIMVAVVSFLTGEGIFYAFGAVGQQRWDHAIDTVRRLDNGGGPVVLPSGVVIARGPFEQKVVHGRLLLGVPLSAIGATWIIAIAMLASSVQCADAVLRVSDHLRADIAGTGVRASASGQGFLRPFRITLVSVWLLASLLILLCFGSLIWNGVTAVRGRTESVDLVAESVGVVDGSLYAIVYVFGLTRWETQVGILARLFWMGAAISVVGLFAGSVGSLAIRRRRTRDRLTRLKGIPAITLDGVELSTVVSNLTRDSGVHIPAVVATPSEEPFATAHVFGVRGRDFFLEISTATLARLDAAETRALLAHELAHVLCGHSARHRTLQYLGRATFVGGAFVGALENSFGYELEADRFAVAKLGADSMALRNCLVKLHIGKLLGTNKQPPSGQTVSGRNCPRVVKRPKQRALRRLRRSLKSWVTVYASEAAVSYWYPSINERLDSLKAMQSNCTQHPAA